MNNGPFAPETFLLWAFREGGDRDRKSAKLERK
jgi:hypothetical protein